MVNTEDRHIETDSKFNLKTDAKRNDVFGKSVLELSLKINFITSFNSLVQIRELIVVQCISS